MFLGHVAVGFASKRLAPRASLGVLMTAPLAYLARTGYVAGAFWIERTREVRPTAS